MSIFTKTDEHVQAPPRNTFDGSFANNLTLKVGQITPCICKAVLPGDSFKIDAKLGFSLDPMVYPVQTDMQCNLHFFYVRNRALWKGWENFITKTENLEGDSTPPFIQLTEENRHMFNTGEIGDYLGVPTMFYGSDNEKYPDTLRGYWRTSSTGYIGKFNTIDSTDSLSILANSISNGTFGDNEASLNTLMSAFLSMYSNNNALTFNDIKLQTKANGTPVTTSEHYVNRIFAVDLPPNTSKFALKATSAQIASALGVTSMSNIATVGEYPYSTVQMVVDVTNLSRYSEGNINIRDIIKSLVVTRSSNGLEYSAVMSYNREIGTNNYIYYHINNDTTEIHKYIFVAFALSYLSAGDEYTVPLGKYDAISTFDARNGIPNEMRSLEQLPFYTTDFGAESSAASRLRITAMPFRAVEACYNAFYRDDRNNPLMIDGKPYYNIWVQNRNGGTDSSVYKLYRKNWMQDVFTTAVQSPQQGIVPIVGATASGYMTFADDDGNTYFMQAKFGEDGHTITGIESYSSDMPQGTLRAMVDTISTGISINDFRNVNALQRWLETNMRKGLRYKDQIEAHFATSPTYSELQMPEFIGGMSRTVKMSAIEQTVDTLNPDTGSGSPLGTLGGRGSIVGNDGKPVTHYFDEHGWIIGFVSVTPVPVYSQQLNKELLKTELMDHYFPEFAHLPFQPILNREIAPLQCKSGQQPDGTGLNDVFGYQRAWYEYLEYQDEVHGDFRTYRKDYLIHRIFNGVPKLGADFLTVSPREANEVFAIQTVDGKEIDHIFGQIFFDIKMKRPFPKLGIPKLEVS